MASPRSGAAERNRTTLVIRGARQRLSRLQRRQLLACKHTKRDPEGPERKSTGRVMVGQIAERVPYPLSRIHFPPVFRPNRPSGSGPPHAIRASGYGIHLPRTWQNPEHYIHRTGAPHRADSPPLGHPPRARRHPRRHGDRNQRATDGNYVIDLAAGNLRHLIDTQNLADQAPAFVDVNAKAFVAYAPGAAGTASPNDAGWSAAETQHRNVLTRLFYCNY